jgi:GrpB-like predicted nucleotidyltransferase (UPF0157 family)
LVGLNRHVGLGHPVTVTHLSTSMYLIGGQQLNPAEADHSLIASMFDRLPGEVKHAGDVTRLVGYESCGGGADRLCFFGIEVDSIETIPEGLAAWELNGDSWAVRRPEDGHHAIVWREDVQWNWRGETSTDRRRLMGEFTGRGPAEWWGDGFTGPRTFSIFAHLFFDCRKCKFRDDIFLVDYDPTWPRQFEEMAGWLRDRLGPNVARRIEHYGSTAIPGMPAKPIVDLLVEVPSFEQGRRRALSLLNDETWEYWSYSNHVVLFKRKELMGQRTHHVHLAPQGHEIWRGLMFRDHLRRHPSDAARYAALKHELAETYRTDRERYTEMKTSFVQQICQKALKDER